MTRSSGRGASQRSNRPSVMRSDTVRRYAEEAGFRTFEVLPIENDFYRFYRLLQ